MKSQAPNVIFLPGNGGSTINDHWFPFLQEKLNGLHIKVTAKNFPDPVLAREKIWIPFIKTNLGADTNSILIGHSSGAVAAMRFAEENRIYGSILIAPSYTDLGDYHEKLSGYFNRPWRWDKIKANQNWIVQFASLDDPYIPINEARHIHEELDTEYFEYDNHGHFGADVFKTEFPEIVTILKRKLNIKVASIM
ncbi:MAG: alpha/beta hydrolase [bacterium]